MTKVITYGTFDLFHYGHRRLLERAKALGDYLIVGVTSDDFDKARGKINVKQSLMERIEAVRVTGLADEIIVEEYEGQKIDDILRYGIDIFTVGSDWRGKFDYLNAYCNVIYLARTEGVSSSELRSEKRKIKIGLVGDSKYLKKFAHECTFVNGIEITGICTDDVSMLSPPFSTLPCVTTNYSELLKVVDAVYLISHPTQHFAQIKTALSMHKHVLCEAPLALSPLQSEELFTLAKESECILMEGLKTAYSTAYSRLLLLVKSGKIGDVVSVDSTITSLQSIDPLDTKMLSRTWNSICAWGPTAMLPIFQLLGVNYQTKQIVSMFADTEKTFDLFTKIDFLYENAVASLKVGKGIRSEGELIVSGTLGNIYVPAPWWKTDYFEIRYEDQTENRRYFYQLEGEGIRYEIVAFLKAIETKNAPAFIDPLISREICAVIHDFYGGHGVYEIQKRGGELLK